MKDLPLMTLGDYSEKIIWIVPQTEGVAVLRDKGFIQVGSARLEERDMNEYGYGPSIGDSNSRHHSSREAKSARLVALGFGNYDLVAKDLKRKISSKIEELLPSGFSLEGLFSDKEECTDSVSDNFIHEVMSHRKLEGDLIKATAGNSTKEERFLYFAVPSGKKIKVVSAKEHLHKFIVSEEEYSDYERNFGDYGKQKIRTEKIGEISVPAKGIAPLYWLENFLFSMIAKGKSRLSQVDWDPDEGRCLG